MTTTNEQKTSARVAELLALAKKHGGSVSPEHVVARARNPSSALHDAFDWDDTEAARQWRIEQARRMLRVLVTVVPHPKSGEPISVRAFFAPRIEGAHVTTPRNYTFTPTLLATKDGRAALYATAKAELAAFERKYAMLEELIPLFDKARQLKLLA